MRDGNPPRLYTLDDLPAQAVAGGRILVRVDFNLPMAEGRILDATRVEEALPTLLELRDKGGRLLLVSHCGRPDGKPDPSQSLRPVVRELEARLGQAVGFVPDCIGDAARQAASALPRGGVCLLENLRFHAGEQANDEGFAAELASLATVYVDDAFGVVHRAHASVARVVEHFEHKAAGRLLVKEVEALGRLLGRPPRPFVALIGGAKIKGKIDTLKNLVERLDSLLVGGGMANTFLTVQGYDLAASKVETQELESARDILARAAEHGVEVLLPVDLVVTDDLEKRERVETVPPQAVPPATMAVDLGPRTRARYGEVLRRAGTVFWNGPAGVFEKPPFDRGSLDLARAVGACQGFTVVGGGETVAVARQGEVLSAIDHVSTGGGSSLEFLAGKTLPGIAALFKA